MAETHKTILIIILKILHRCMAITIFNICSLRETKPTTTIIGLITQKVEISAAIRGAMVNLALITNSVGEDTTILTTNFPSIMFATDASSLVITFEIALKMEMPTLTRARTVVFQSSTSGKCN